MGVEGDAALVDFHVGVSAGVCPARLNARKNQPGMGDMAALTYRQFCPFPDFAPGLEDIEST